MIDAIGIVNFEDSSVNVKGMSDFRSIPAMSFLGRYRIIDFTLSNMVNSGIDELSVLVKNKPRSLIEHLGNGSNYNINLKSGYLNILYTDNNAMSDAYFHDIYVMHSNIEKFQESNAKYVVISPSYMIYRINYNDVIRAHEESGADITCVYQEVNNANQKYIGCKTIDLDKNGVVTAIGRNKGNKKSANILTETYVIDRELFVDLVEKAPVISPLYSLIDVITSVVDSLKVCGYEHKGYLACINSLEEYYDANMEMIDYEKAAELFDPDWPIYTKTNDSQPAFYSKNAHAKNCLIANGCIINGDLENCICGRGVTVGKGAVIKNTLLLPECYIAPMAHIENAVIDKHSSVERKLEIIGKDGKLAYVKRRDRV